MKNVLFVYKVKNILVYPWFEPTPSIIIVLHLVCNRRRRRFRPHGYFPFAAVDVLNSELIQMYMYFIYMLNIIFRHMHVPRDTSVLRQIIIVRCESVGVGGKLPNSVQRRTFATCE